MLGSTWNVEDYPWKVGDRVKHYKDMDGLPGTIKVVEENGLSVLVQWDDFSDGELDFQWANKLRKYEAK
jgi:hypothetical protein